MAVVEKSKIVGKLTPLTVRLPNELALELPLVAEYMMTKDQSELVRGWIRENSLRIIGSRGYQAWKKMKAEHGT